MMAMDLTNNGKWIIDRHIPVAVLIALAVQTMGAIWWAATVNATQEAFKQRIEGVERQTTLLAAQGNQLAALSENVKNLQDSFKDLKTYIQQLPQKR